MKLRIVAALAAGLGLWLGGMAAAQDKSTKASRSSNQDLANKVAAKLEGSGALRGRIIDVVCSNGVIELKGKVTDAAQHDAVLNATMSVAGVKSVIDSMTLVSTMPVRPVAANEPAAPPAGPNVLPAPLGAPIVDPIPLGQPGGAMPYDLNTPKLPPHAWPTYAPYNNYSRVAYPEAYPYNAWPFIGPFYPFPKVPLGWRSVTLEWQDGHWWLGRNGTKQDYWRVRYW